MGPLYPETYKKETSEYNFVSKASHKSYNDDTLLLILFNNKVVIKYTLRRNKIHDVLQDVSDYYIKLYTYILLYIYIYIYILYIYLIYYFIYIIIFYSILYYILYIWA